MSGFCSKYAILAHRFGEWSGAEQFARQHRLLRPLLRPLYHLFRYFSVILCKVVIQEGTEIGRGVRLSDKGRIILGAERIGDECVIHHDVTLGLHLAANKAHGGKPSLGNMVWLGPHTIAHGKISIGSGVTVLGNTVLTKNVPAQCVVTGNPGKIVLRGFDNACIRCCSPAQVNLDMIKESQGRV